MKLSIKIMAHEKRAHFIPDLVQRLGLTDDDVIWDRIGNRWDTGRRAWEAIDQSADWGCVVQDDALVAGDFAPGLAAALEHVPTECLVSPYVGTRRPASTRVEMAVRAAIERDAVFIAMPSLNWGVAIAAPTSIIDNMLPWCDQQSYPNYDRRIGRYAMDVLHWPTWCTFPSLVDHRVVPSLVGHGGGRVAHHFLGEDRSALDVDWSAGHVNLVDLSARRTAKWFTPSGTNVYGQPQARTLRVAKKRFGGVDVPPSRGEPPAQQVG